MKFTLCTENKVFPYLIIDDFYDKIEQELIWEELDFHRNDFEYDKGTGKHGVAWDENNKPIAKLKRIYLEEIYSNRQDSNILNLYSKIFSKNVRTAYQLTTPSWRTFEITNKDVTMINYYEDQDNYGSHFDKFMHTAVLWFYKTPKRFKGGNIIFPQQSGTVECVHNRLILFPSYYLHEVEKVEMEEQYRNKGLGRYSIVHFYNKE